MILLSTSQPKLESRYKLPRLFHGSGSHKRLSLVQTDLDQDPKGWFKRIVQKFLRYAYSICKNDACSLFTQTWYSFSANFLIVLKFTAAGSFDNFAETMEPFIE
jgi:hypothetical protein